MDLTTTPYPSRTPTINDRLMSLLGMRSRLREAIERGNAQAIEALLVASPAAVNQPFRAAVPSDLWVAPLTYAVRERAASAVEVLLRHGAPVGPDTVQAAIHALIFDHDLLFMAPIKPEVKDRHAVMLGILTQLNDHRAEWECEVIARDTRPRPQTVFTPTVEPSPRHNIFRPAREVLLTFLTPEQAQLVGLVRSPDPIIAAQVEERELYARTAPTAAAAPKRPHRL